MLGGVDRPCRDDVVDDTVEPLHWLRKDLSPSDRRLVEMDVASPNGRMRRRGSVQRASQARLAISMKSAPRETGTTVVLIERPRGPNSELRAKAPPGPLPASLDPIVASSTPPPRSPCPSRSQATLQVPSASASYLYQCLDACRRESRTTPRTCLTRSPGPKRGMYSKAVSASPAAPRMRRTVVDCGRGEAKPKSYGARPAARENLRTAGV